MRIEIYCDERYPDYRFIKNPTGICGIVVNVPKELVRKFEKIMREYEWLQKQLKQLHEQGEKQI